MDFKDNLRFAMERKDLQIKELSAASGVSENTLKSYFRSDSAEPKLSKVVQLAQALDVSVDFLATGQEKSSKEKVNPQITKLTRTISRFSQKDLDAVSSIIGAIDEKYKRI